MKTEEKRGLAKGAEGRAEGENWEEGGTHKGAKWGIYRLNIDVLIERKGGKGSAGA